MAAANGMDGILIMILEHLGGGDCPGEEESSVINSRNSAGNTALRIKIQKTDFRLGSFEQ